MKKELAKGIKLISCNSLDCASMQSIAGGNRKLVAVEGGACCICNPGQANTGIGATEKARH